MCRTGWFSANNAEVEAHFDVYAEKHLLALCFPAQCFSTILTWKSCFI